MASQIDSSRPLSGQNAATFTDLRANFTRARDEITALQNAGGAPGPTGATGPTGAVGMAGASGATGVTGVAGVTGATGVAGGGGPPVTIQASQPAGSNGQLWFNSTNATLWLHHSGGWDGIT